MRKNLLNIVRVVVSVLLLYLLFRKINFKDILTILKTANTPVFLLSFLGYFLLLITSALRWWILLYAQGVKLPYHRTLIYYIIGMFFNNFLPPTIGGGAVRAFYVGKVTGKNKESFASMTVELILGLLGLLIFLAILLLFYLGREGGKVMLVYILGATIFLIAVIFVFLQRGIVKRLKPIVLRIKFFGMGKKLIDFYNAMYLYRGKKLVILEVILLSFCVQASIGIMNFFIGKSLGFNISFLSYIILPSIVSIITMLPSIGGLGIREASYVFFFKSVGLTGAQSLSLSLIFYFCGVIGSLPGVIFFSLGRSLRGKGSEK